jgi:hypothetical protein
VRAAEVGTHRRIAIANTTDHDTVGFTGSGKGMTETHKRQRYDHKKDADEEYETAEPKPAWKR